MNQYYAKGDKQYYDSSYISKVPLVILLTSKNYYVIVMMTYIESQPSDAVGGAMDYSNDGGVLDTLTRKTKLYDMSLKAICLQCDVIL